MAITMKQAKEVCKELNMKLEKDKNSDELRLNFKGGKEATEYYTTDLQDAVATARAMRLRSESMKATK